MKEDYMNSIAEHLRILDYLKETGRGDDDLEAELIDLVTKYDPEKLEEVRLKVVRIIMQTNGHH